MKTRFFILLIFSLCFYLANCNFATAQNINSIRAKCPVAIGGYSSITLLSGGDINAIPCATKNFLVNGSPIGGGGTIGGTTTANFIPYSTGVDTLANSPLSWNGTIYTFNNTALTSQYKMDFTPDATSGSFNVGDYTTTPTYYFQTTFAGNTELASKEIAIGDIQATSTGIRFDISDIAGTFTFTNGNVHFPLGNTGSPVPSITTATDTNTGFALTGSNFIAFVSNGKFAGAIQNNGTNDFYLGDSTFTLSWNNTVAGAFGAGGDTGLTRHAAGVLKVTNAGTGVRSLFGGGTAVASAAALPLPTGNIFHVTGTTNITSITSTNFQSGVCITLIFDDVLTFTDGSNLVLAGNFVTTTDDTISLCYDGTNWYETARSVN